MVVEELSRQSHEKSWVEKEQDALEKIIPNSIKNQLNKKSHLSSLLPRWFY